MLDHRCSDLSKGSERPKWNPDEDVFGRRAIGSSVLDFFGGAEQELLDLDEVLGLALFVGNEALSNDFLELGVLFTLKTVSCFFDLRSS